MMPRQGAIPCLILIVLIVLALGVLLFFSLRSTG
jgi:hypothetical protein